jgi:hypothetical protein
MNDRWLTIFQDSPFWQVLTGNTLLLKKTATGTGGALAEQAAHDEISQENGADHQQTEHNPCVNAQGFCQVGKDLQNRAGDFRKIRIHSLFSNKLF